MTRTVTISPSVYYFGTPVVLLTTSMPDGRTNITPISSAWALGSTYVVGLSTLNQGTENLLRTHEAVLNLADAGLAPRIEEIASTTGSSEVPEGKRDLYTHEPDKWRRGGFSRSPNRDVAPDRVDECPVQIEARLTDVVPIGSEAVALHLRAVVTHAHDSVVVPGSNHIDLDLWRPLFYTFRHYFGQGDRVGVSFKAEQ